MGVDGNWPKYGACKTRRVIIAPQAAEGGRSSVSAEAADVVGSIEGLEAAMLPKAVSTQDTREELVWAREPKQAPASA